MRTERLAWAGWAAAVLVVPVTVDVTAHVRRVPSMSRAFSRAALHPMTGPVVIGAAAGLVWHLAQTVLSEYEKREK